MKDYRTFVVAIIGLVYLLALAWVAGSLDLDPTTTNGLALSGVGVVGALAGKSAVQHATAKKGENNG